MIKRSEDAATGFLRRGIQLTVTEMKGSDGQVDSTTFVVLNEYDAAKYHTHHLAPRRAAT